MPKQKTQVKVLTGEQKKLKQEKQKRNGEIVCSFMMMSLGVISTFLIMSVASPKLLGFFFQKDMFPEQFKVPGLLTYFGLIGGFMFFLTVVITLMRILGKKPSPAMIKDSPRIVSMNQAMKNTIIYNAIFLGLYYHLSLNWKKEAIILELSPYIIFVGLIFDFVMRLFELLIGAKGFRYLPQAIILFFLTVLTFECFNPLQTE